MNWSCLASAIRACPYLYCRSMTSCGRREKHLRICAYEPSMEMVSFTNNTKGLEQKERAQVVVSGVATNSTATLSCESVRKPSRAALVIMISSFSHSVGRKKQRKPTLPRGLPLFGRTAYEMCSPASWHTAERMKGTGIPKAWETFLSGSHSTVSCRNDDTSRSKSTGPSGDGDLFR